MSKPSHKNRNLLHNHPMLRKGGVHQKTRKAQRRGDKQALRKAWPFPRMRLSAACSERAAPALTSGQLLCAEESSTFPANSCDAVRVQLP